MRKCIVIPDSFKGTMSSIEVCGIMKEKLSEAFPDCEIVAVPAADGGEGTVDCFLRASGGEKIELTVKGPHLDEIQSYYGIIGDTAVIEMAAAAALGANFFDSEENEFLPTGGSLGRIAGIDLAELRPRLEEITFTHVRYRQSVVRAARRSLRLRSPKGR